MDEEYFKRKDNLPIVTKNHIESILKEIDPKQVIDEKAMNLILKDLNTFSYKILNKSCDLAVALNDKILSWKHLSTELQINHNVNIPGYSNVTDESNNLNNTTKKSNYID